MESDNEVTSHVGVFMLGLLLGAGVMALIRPKEVVKVRRCPANRGKQQKE